MSKQFEESKTKGVHFNLSLMAGEWEGITKTWFEPEKLADESQMTGKISVILDGLFLKYEYKGTMQGKPFEGMAIYGYSFYENRYQCAWIDSFHMGTGILFSQGTEGDKGKKFSVLGSYAYPGVSERWGWKTEIELIDNDKLIIIAYNITPDGQEAKATETIYNRKK